MDKIGLEHLLSSYNWWMAASTVAVAVGILGEYVAHFVFEKEARRNRLEMTVSIIFGVFVLGGVVGEWIFGTKLSQASEQLQSIADTEVAQSNLDAATARKDAEVTRKQSADTNKRAAEAEQHAGQENERAAKALQSAEIARRNAESFQLEIASANERAANAEKESARLSKEAEEERLARAKIEEKLAWRALSREQQGRISSKLHPFLGQEFTIVTYADDAEAINLRDSMFTILQSAGWQYPNQQFSMLMVLVRGVSVGISPSAKESTKLAASILELALRREDIAANVDVFEFDDRTTVNTILIRVGKKP